MTKAAVSVNVGMFHGSTQIIPLPAPQIQEICWLSLLSQPSDPSVDKSQRIPALGWCPGACEDGDAHLCQGWRRHILLGLLESKTPQNRGAGGREEPLSCFAESCLALRCCRASAGLCWHKKCHQGWPGCATAANICTDVHQAEAEVFQPRGSVSLQRCWAQQDFPPLHPHSTSNPASNETVPGKSLAFLHGYQHISESQLLSPSLKFGQSTLERCFSFDPFLKILNFFFPLSIAILKK